MAVQYIREKTKQRYFLISFGFIILITIIVLWFGFFKDSFSFQSELPVSYPTVLRSAINIDFDFLTSQTLKDMDVFNQVSSFEGKVGKENPFSESGVGSAVIVEETETSAEE